MPSDVSTTIPRHSAVIVIDDRFDEHALRRSLARSRHAQPERLYTRSLRRIEQHSVLSVDHESRETLNALIGERFHKHLGADASRISHRDPDHGPLRRR